jgi:hypothetical protein
VGEFAGRLPQPRIQRRRFDPPPLPPGLADIPNHLFDLALHLEKFVFVSDHLP